MVDDTSSDSDSDNSAPEVRRNDDAPGVRRNDDARSVQRSRGKLTMVGGQRPCIKGSTNSRLFNRYYRVRRGIGRGEKESIGIVY